MSDDRGINTEDGVSSTVDSVLNEAGNVGSAIRERGSELGRKAVDSIDDRRSSVADGLDGAARGLHNRADAIFGGGERVSRATHNVADKVEGASRYVREKDAKEMFADVEKMVREHPVRSLLAVLVVGYLAGRALRSD